MQTWVKLDTGFFTDPVVASLSKDAKLLYLAAMSYCGQHLTDGLITTAAARILLATVEADSSAITELMVAGLWLPEDAGWRLREYLEDQQSRADVERLRAERADAGHKGGVQSGITRRSKRSKNEASASGASISVNTADSPAAADPPPDPPLNAVFATDNDGDESATKQTKQNASKTRSKTRSKNEADTDTDTDTDNEIVVVPTNILTLHAGARRDLDRREDTRTGASPRAPAPASEEGVIGDELLWWRETVYKRAQREGLDAEALLARVSVEDETERYLNLPAERQGVWRNWMLRALGFAVRDEKTDTAKGGARERVEAIRSNPPAIQSGESAHGPGEADREALADRERRRSAARAAASQHVPRPVPAEQRSGAPPGLFPLQRQRDGPHVPPPDALGVS